MKIISSATLKGGTGKTSLSFHLGGTLAKRGNRVLLADLDPQSSLTQSFWGSKVFSSLDPRRSIAEVWDGEPLPERVIHPSGLDMVWLLPGHEAATRFNMIPREDWGERIESVSLFLREVRDDFDYAILDCAPNLHLCSHAALVAADEVIVPLQAEDPGAGGLVSVSRAVRSVHERWGRPSILGYLMNMHNRRLAIHQAYESSLRQIYGDLVFDTTIPYATQYKESVAARTPVSHYKPRSSAAKAYAALADEIQARLEARRVAPNAA